MGIPPNYDTRPHTARASSSHSARSAVRIFNRPGLAEVSRACLEDDLDAALGDFDSRLNTEASHTTGHAVSLHGNRYAAGMRRSVAQDNVDKKRHEAMQSLRHKREEDMRTIREKVEHARVQRDQRFDLLMDDLNSQWALKSDVAETLRAWDQDCHRRNSQMYEQWNERVFSGVQKQVGNFLNPSDRSKQQMMEGAKNVGFRLPTDIDRVNINPADDPMKQGMLSTANEEAFRKTAASIVHGEPVHRGPDGQPSFDARTGPMSFKNQRTGRTRPVLEVPLWGQAKLYGTPYGYFELLSQQGGDGGHIRTQTKLHNFMGDESDGVEIAGKRATRYTKGDLGVLKRDGQVAKRGQTSLYKRADGASSGAPGQDHYLYEIGEYAVDAEFPLGKRIWKPPPGEIPRMGLDAL